MISVIITFLNAELTLKKCVESILNQTYKDFEIILVNDGSTDKSLDTAIKLKNKNNSIIHIIDKRYNEGLEKARYDGRKVAKGEYLTFVDADDWLEKDTLEIMYNEIKTSNYDYVEIGMNRVLDNHSLLKKKRTNPVIGEIAQPELFDKYFLSFLGVNILSVNMCGKLYNKEVIEKNNISIQGVTMGEDLAFNLQLFPHLKKIKIIPYNGYNYKFGGMTTKYNKNLLPDLKKLYTIKKELIDKYQYYKASDYIRIELKNVLISDIKQRLLFKYGSKEVIINQINQELMDSIWNDIQQIKNSNIIASPIVQAVINKDANTIYRLCKSETRKYYPQWILKRVISKILSLI